MNHAQLAGLLLSTGCQQNSLAGKEVIAAGFGGQSLGPLGKQQRTFFCFFCIGTIITSNVIEMNYKFSSVYSVCHTVDTKLASWHSR